MLERLVGQVAEVAHANRWEITISMGAVTFSEPPASLGEALDAADRAMYEAKRAGKNQICFASETPHHEP